MDAYICSARKVENNEHSRVVIGDEIYSHLLLQTSHIPDACWDVGCLPLLGCL